MSLIAVVIDTNVLISALLFGGKPREVFQMVIDRRVQAISSSALLSELLDVLAKRFLFLKPKLLLVERKMTKVFTLVYPSEHIDILSDKADNRVLEAARAGQCTYIITGDKELLKLGSYKTISIVTPEQFVRNTTD